MRTSRLLRSLERIKGSFHLSETPLCPTRRRLLRTFTTTTTDTNQEERRPGPLPLTQRIRIVPQSPSYFSGRPVYEDLLLTLRSLLAKYAHLPRANNSSVSAWRSLEQFNDTMDAENQFEQWQYNNMTDLLQKLSKIHPQIVPQEVQDLVDEHKRTVNKMGRKKSPRLIDEWGRTLGVGRRKTSMAKAYLVPGEGEILVNGRKVSDYFARLHDRESAMWALKVTGRLDRYNVFGLVNGGGVTGQAEAMTIAVAKALGVMEPHLMNILATCEFILEWTKACDETFTDDPIASTLTRDPRMVERKKHGHVKARKMPAWVKR